MLNLSIFFRNRNEKYCPVVILLVGRMPFSTWKYIRWALIIKTVLLFTKSLFLGKVGLMVLLLS